MCLNHYISVAISILFDGENISFDVSLYIYIYIYIPNGRYIDYLSLTFETNTNKILDTL